METLSVSVNKDLQRTVPHSGTEPTIGTHFNILKQVPFFDDKYSIDGMPS